ncbi:hypothetical protein FOFC_14724 [Fusarium oxysporum]|nr:hypothetical protein FOFC_14724 [Fusarium oxysporum]
MFCSSSSSSSCCFPLLPCFGTSHTALEVIVLGETGGGGLYSDLRAKGG